jgi:Holliday junction resolvase RusA-like endonuclease
MKNIPSFYKILGIGSEKNIEKRELKKKVEKEMWKLSKLLLTGKATQQDLDNIEKLNKEYLDKYGTLEEKSRFKEKMIKLRSHVKIGV